MGEASMRIVRLVDFAIAYDPSGTVGSPIDVLELDRDGNQRWNQNQIAQ
jgi:hypothetical protein